MTDELEEAFIRFFKQRRKRLPIVRFSPLTKWDRRVCWITVIGSLICIIGGILNIGR